MIYFCKYNIYIKRIVKILMMSYLCIRGLDIYKIFLVILRFEKLLCVWK